MTAPAPARRAPSAAVHRKISNRKRETLQGAAAAGVQSLLWSARILLDKEASSDAAAILGDPGPGDLAAVAAALHTYAVEEYGKLLLLGSLPEEDGVVSVPHRVIFRSHDKKFNAALEKIPAECALIRQGPPDLSMFNPTIFDMGMDASFESRTRLLYLDMDSNGNPTAPRPPAPAHLAKAVAGLERAVADWVAQGGPVWPGGAAPGRGGEQGQ